MCVSVICANSEYPAKSKENKLINRFIGSLLLVITTTTKVTEKFILRFQHPVFRTRETFRGTGATPVNRRPSFHRSHPAPYSLACIGLPHLPAAAHRMRTPGARTACMFPVAARLRDRLPEMTDGLHPATR